MHLNSKTKDIIVHALLWGFALFLFREVLIWGHRLGGTDFIAFYLGMKQFLFDEIHRHHAIPFWNPFIFGGMPYWAHFESTIFYPLGCLFWLLPADRAYGYTMFIHLALAGSFMVILARSFKISRLGSLLAGAVYMGNGFVMALLYLGQMSPIQSYIWLPLIIFFLHLSVIRERPGRYAATAGMLWGVQILAGAPQDAFYTFIASLLFLFYHVKPFLRNRWEVFRPALSASLLFLFGAGLASMQLFPAFELINESVRAAMDDYRMVTLGSYPPEGLIRVFMPHFFGDYTQASFWVDNVPWSISEQNLYVGVLPIFLILFTPFRHTGSGRLMLFAVSLALLALLLSMGKHTPLYKGIYLLPGFDRFRSPFRIIVLWVFAVGLLAGRGIDHFSDLTKTGKVGPRLVILCCLVMIFIALVLWLHIAPSMTLKLFSIFVLEEAIPSKMGLAVQAITGELQRFVLISSAIVFFMLLISKGIMKLWHGALLLCLFTMVDLAWINGHAVQNADKTYKWISEIRQGLDSKLEEDRGPYRVGSFRFPLGPNLEMYLGYQSVGGFTALFLDRYYRYMNAYAEGKLPEGWQSLFYGREKNSVLMDLLNVKYEISHEDRRVMLRKNSLPRAFTVPKAKTFKEEEILDHLTTPRFDPTQVVLLEERSDIPAFLRESKSHEKGLGKAEIISYRPDHILLSAESHDPAYLFLSEIHYPGWKAFMDENPQPIYRGNYLFRVIELPKGRHSVRFVFDPFSIKAGIAVTVFTLFMFINLLVYDYSKRTNFLKRST
jgi:hypothetical protein